MKMIPGMSGLMNQAGLELSGDELKPIEAIVSSMTKAERKDPELLSHARTGGSRRRRIAKGSGTSVNDVNHLVKQFKAMKRMMGELTRGGNLGQLMSAQGIKDMVPQMPGGKALGKKLGMSGPMKRDPKDKRGRR